MIQRTISLKLFVGMLWTIIFNPQPVLSKNADSVAFNHNFLFIKPIIFSSDVAELNDFWLEAGYERMIHPTWSVEVSGGGVIASLESKGPIRVRSLPAIRKCLRRNNFPRKHLLSLTFNFVLAAKISTEQQKR